MYKTVFILGAGASADAGIPVMKDFLSKAEDLYNTNLLEPKEKQAFDEVLEAIHRLKGISYQLKNDLNNIETVFGLLDMGRMLGKLGDVSPDKIDELFIDIQKVIGLTIDFNTVIHNDEKGDARIKGPIHRFASFIDEIYLQDNRSDVAIITFNYDIALEYAMQYCNLFPNYYINGKTEPGRLPLLKLHGSLNWAADKDGKLMDWNVRSILNRVGTLGRADACRLIVARHFFNNNSPLEFKTTGPFLVPPTWNKGLFHQQIERVWKKAVAFLSNAQAIYVIGYSMPETDMFFRHLLSIASYSRTNIRQFWVFDPSPEVGERFQKIISDGLMHAFYYKQVDFGSAINHIISENRFKLL